MKLSKSSAAILMGTVIPFSVIVVIIAMVYAIRRYRNNAAKQYTKYGYMYNKVNHGLDDEEMEFKKMIESKMSDTDLDDLFSDDTTEDISFDSKDKDRLNMLEQFRNNLVAGSSNHGNNYDLNSSSDFEEGDDNLRL
eukprot:gene12402-16635_t